MTIFSSVICNSPTAVVSFCAWDYVLVLLVTIIKNIKTAVWFFMNFHIFHFGDRYPKNSNEEIFIHLVLWMWMFSQMSLWYNAQSGNPSKITSNPFLCWESCNWISVCGTVNCLGTYHWSRSSSNSAIKIGSVAVWGFPGKIRISFCKRIKPGCGSCEIAIHYYLKETAIMRPA